MFAKTRKTRRLASIIFVLLFLSGTAAAFSYFLYGNFFTGQILYLSPLAKQQETLDDRLEKALLGKGIAFNQIVASSSSYLVFLDNGGQVVLPSNNSIESKIYSLQSILKQFTIEGKRFKKIDFRFDKPVIVLE